MKPMPRSIPSSVRKKFGDDFERPDTESEIGTAPDGSLWNTLRGVFRITGNKISLVSNPSELPVSVISMPTSDNTIEMQDMGNGTAAALWVTDAGNWWAVGIDQETVDCNCETCSSCVRWNSLQCVQANASVCVANSCGTWNASTCANFACNQWTLGNCATWNSVNCTAWNSGSCNRWNSATSNCNSFVSQCTTWIFTGTADRPRFSCSAWRNVCSSPAAWNSSGSTCNRWNSGNCATFSGGTCSSRNASSCTRWTCAQFNSTSCSSWFCSSFVPGNCIAFATQNCNSWVEFPCNCQTCYPQYIRVIQSMGSTISTIFSSMIPGTLATSVTRLVRSLRLLVNSEEVVVEQFANPDLTDKIDNDLIYTPTGAQIVSQYGIIVRPSAHNPNYSVGGIEINRR